MKDQVRRRLLTAAQRHFLERGYAGASLRAIATEAGVSLGGIYTYFRSKDELFGAVVSPLTRALDALLDSHHGHEGADLMSLRSAAYGRRVAEEYVDLFRRFRPLMTLLLTQARGSSLEDYARRYADRSLPVVMEWFDAQRRRHPEFDAPVEAFFVRMHSVWMFVLFEQLLRYSGSAEETERIVRDYVRFEIEGWRAIVHV